ncbi:hypothetical protein [Pseudomonas bohemica]|uniref:hypothetical protein n=1 Tax=Pseudomonas bohemica TaxID=2044872 RepID=UPI0018FE2C5E|nr:hypothetical protein [Pseudomonas bohemica]
MTVDQSLSDRETRHLSRWWPFAMAPGLRRGVESASVRPGCEVLWTVVNRAEKYTSRNIVETLVYRGGDAATTVCQ